MRIIFAGTPYFASAALEAIVESGHEVALVLTQPDRPSGRGRKMKPSEVKQMAEKYGLEVRTPASLSLKKNPEEAEEIRRVMKEKEADLLIVAAYGLIIPADILEIPKGIAIQDALPLKAMNIHGSLLPQWRGAAPIARGIEAQDKEAGITLMEMEAGLDTGPMLYKKARPLDGTETAGPLTEELARLGAQMTAEFLKNPGAFKREAQDDSLSIYASKLQKDESPLDFSKSAEELSAKIRAFNPFPGTTAGWGETVLKIWNALPKKGEKTGAPAGTVLRADKGGLEVACGDGTVLSILELQKPGGKHLPFKQFLAGVPIKAGEVLK